jgi:hypothetical protein
LLAAAAPAALAEAWPTGEVVAPSGQLLVLQDVMFEENPWSGETQVAVRLLAPMIAGEGLLPTELRDDMEFACRTWGLPAAATLASPPDWVVVEMMEAPAERGTATPGIRRYFEQYRLQGPDCIWELF